MSAADHAAARNPSETPSGSPGYPHDPTSSEFRHRRPPVHPNPLPPTTLNLNPVPPAAPLPHPPSATPSPLNSGTSAANLLASATHTPSCPDPTATTPWQHSPFHPPRLPPSSTPHSTAPSTAPSAHSSVTLPLTSPKIIRIGDLSVEQPDMDSEYVPPRVRTYGYRTFMATASLTLVLLFLVTGLVKTVMYAMTTNQPIYFAALLFYPTGALYLTFGAVVVMGGIFISCFGPLYALKTNCQTYSVLRTPPPKGVPLPPIVVMMPVYKEDMDEVIVPTHESLQRAMDYYTSKGGSTWWLICDDGYMLVPKKESSKRLVFYAENNMTFVARPGHTEEKPRRGLFKKASNMNYTLRLGDLVKERMAADPSVTVLQALNEIWHSRDKEFRCGGENLLIPDNALILLIDADTRVPPTCLYDTVGEFMQSPELAYTQHYTTPFEDQQSNYFESLISMFTRKIYFQGFVVPCSLGAGAPLVGHNAFLRFQSMKTARFHCPDEGYDKYWSEDTVSEDYDMYMRLAQMGMFGRLVAYTGEEFREGVSMTYIDELIKFRKFAYGCCEMVFNRFKDWPRKGPITATFRGYLASSFIPWPEKFHMVAYLCTYLAMATAFYTMLFEAAMSVFMPGLYDNFGTRSFDINLTCIFIFGFVGTLSILIHILRVRAIAHPDMPPQKSILAAYGEELFHVPFFSLFFGSMLFQLTTASACYFLDLKLVWGATVKERSQMSAWAALKFTIEAYWKMYVTMSVILGIYILATWYYSIDMYRGWGLYAYCILQMIGPILLNPDIMNCGYAPSE